MNDYNRRTFLKASSLAAAGMLSPRTASAEESKAKPNVLFIAVDDLNDWVGYMGGHPQSHTPHIDALAKKGVAFRRAYCPAPVCGPSRTALMYGMYPHKSGSYGHHKLYAPKALIPKREPLNLTFQKNGYYTAGCGKIFHYGEPRGWDAYQRGFKGLGVTNRKRLGEGIQLSCGIIDTSDDSDTPDGKLTDWAIGQLRRKHDKPFFIALGLRKPHLPWDAPRKYFKQHPLEKVKLPPAPKDDLDDVPAIGKEFARSLVGFFTPEDHKAITAVDGAWEKLVQAYLATSSFADANVGRLLASLERSEHLDNTIVVLWGDHGWHLGEKNHWRKMTLWERGTRTPFIIRMPGGKSGSVDAPVSLQDIYPTLVDLCGLESSQELDGNSLQPLLADPVKGEAWNKPVLISHGPGNFAVRQGQWRLIRYADGSEELYDIKSDPGELVNLARKPGYGDRRKQLASHIPTEWRYVMGPRFKKFPDAFAPPKAKITD